MKLPGWTRRLLDSTRGQIILRLREESRTVADLAAELGVTDNAIRAHLATLERDGLVRQRGERAGFRKPHFSYELTKEADELFPKAYAPVLAQLLTVMKEQLGGTQTEALLEEAGRRMVPPPAKGRPTMEERLERAVESFGSIGGHATITHENEKITIGNSGCPLAAATEKHPEVCAMVGMLLSEVVGVPVRCVCERNPSPRCRFEIDVAPGNKKAVK